MRHKTSGIHSSVLYLRVASGHLPPAQCQTNFHCKPSTFYHAEREREHKLLTKQRLQRLIKASFGELQHAPKSSSRPSLAKREREREEAGRRAPDTTTHCCRHSVADSAKLGHHFTHAHFTPSSPTDGRRAPTAHATARRRYHHADGVPHTHTAQMTLLSILSRSSAGLCVCVTLKENLSQSLIERERERSQAP